MRRLEQYIQVGQKQLRCGYTTGTCAAGAARAAAELLLRGEAPAVVRVDTPAGVAVDLEIEQAGWEERMAVCAVRKDGGDDSDVTDGLLIVAKVSRTGGAELEIDGGEGVGRVTRHGLDQPVGNAAINGVPRRMIAEQVGQVAQKAGYTGGLRVEICIPKGREVAQRTFNPRLGIEGGLSVLGTSGIVRPMSEDALKASIYAELNIKRAEGAQHLLLSLGNYGADFCREVLELELNNAVQCSNYIGDTLDRIATMGFASVLLVGHIGKLVKCAAGVMNTHSKVADCRMETITAHAALQGAERATIQALMNAATTDAAIPILQEVGLLEQTMQSITSAAAKHLRRRVGGAVHLELMLFSNQFGMLGETEGARGLILHHKIGGRDII